MTKKEEKQNRDREGQRSLKGCPSPNIVHDKLNKKTNYEKYCNIKDVHKSDT